MLLLESGSKSKEKANVRKIANKLHRQFGHPTSDKLVKLLRDAGHANKELEEEVDFISRSCETCMKFQRAPPRPVVGLPMARKFNETIAMDLKVWNQVYFLVIIDLATRFCAAAVISNKQPSTIIRTLFTCWITTFGSPKKILTDNGREFNNEELRELGEAFNIKIMATAAEASWSNGVCEKLNQVLGNHVRKILDDSKCDLGMALAWAVSARNALSNNSGFSPNQLVFGMNPHLPSVFENQPPALEPINSSDVVRRNLNALHSAREEFVRFESDERIKRALRHNVRDNHLEELYIGDEVFYKRKDSNQWRGPGIVIGRDGKQVLVRQGGELYRVHTCQLARLHNLELASGNYSHNTGSEDISGIDFNGMGVGERNPSNIVDILEGDSISEGLKGSEVGHGNPDSGSEGAQVRDAGGNDEVNSQENSAVAENDRMEERSMKSWKKGERFEAIDSLSGEMFTGKILGRAGKASGPKKHFYNIEKDSDGWQGWYDLEAVKELKSIPDDKEVQVMFNSAEVKIAKEREIRNWNDNQVYEEVDDKGQKVTSSRWVITEKIKDGNTVTKARLVARGFEEN